MKSSALRRSAFHATGDAYADHAVHAVWFGQSLPLKLDQFRK
ncbi:hypothetical protein [Pseudorhodoplanes sp.]|nr:hypothetical protein [Pseudorhodoplanes sp.]HWV52448.1 hypothetical protein [Pseudorhodoplanes sp.]